MDGKREQGDNRDIVLRIPPELAYMVAHALGIEANCAMLDGGRDQPAYKALRALSRQLADGMGERPPYRLEERAFFACLSALREGPGVARVSFGTSWHGARWGTLSVGIDGRSTHVLSRDVEVDAAERAVEWTCSSLHRASSLGMVVMLERAFRATVGFAASDGWREREAAAEREVRTRLEAALGVADATLCEIVRVGHVDRTTDVSGTAEVRVVVPFDRDRALADAFDVDDRIAPQDGEGAVPSP